LPRKTDADCPADWLWIAASDLEGLRLLAERELSHTLCRGKLSEVLEKIMKAELIRSGWRLEKTHDLERLLEALVTRSSDLCVKIEPLCDALADSYFTARYPGFDLDDPDWPALRAQVEQVAALLAAVQSRIIAPAP
jgi:HEPN domain-containing protein